MNPDSFLTDEIKNLIKTEPTPVAEPVKKVSQKTDFLKIGTEHWSKAGSQFVACFQKGEMISNYNTVAQYDHLSFFTGLYRVIEEMVREEMLKRELEFTDTKEILKIMESSFKLLSVNLEQKMKHASKLNDNGTVEAIDINTLFSSIHGFISSYIQKNADD
jgi:hypothetical protein